MTNRNVNDDYSPEELCTDDAETGPDLDSDQLTKMRIWKIIHKFASVLLKLNINSHIPSSAVDVLLEDLHFVFTSAVVPITNGVAVDVVKTHDLSVDQLVIDELSIVFSNHNPLVKAIAEDGPLATAFKRKQYYKQHFKVVEPVEYVLDARAKKTYKYMFPYSSLYHSC